jgi:hypothetical protein
MAMRRIVQMAAIGICVAAFARAASGQVFVSPAGNDANPGTLTMPVATLEHAAALARDQMAFASSAAATDVRIVLEAGVYRLRQPLSLGPEHSGVNGHNLIFAAATGARPVISGAVRVTGWRRVDAAKNVWQAAVPAGVKDSRQMYVDGVRASRTRARLPVELTMTAAGYTATDSTMAKWRNASDLEFVYTGGNPVWSEPSVGLGSWTEPRCPVAKIEGPAITMAEPCWTNSTQRAMLPNGSRTANLVGPKSVGRQPTYVENAFELLGTQGQFYFDRPAGQIYYVPRRGEDLTRADVELPVLETLVELRGTAERPVHNIVFQGIQFSYATWLGPDGPDGFSEIQAGYQVTGPDGAAKQALCMLVPGGTCPYGAWTKEPANVRASYAREVRFTHDAFVHLGAAGLDLGAGAQRDVVEGSVFTDISGNGLELAGVDAPLASDAEFASDNRIENNLFRAVGAEYRGGIGIVIGYARRTHVAHNQLTQMPYAAISIGWGGWPDKIQMAGQANRSTANVIEKNLVHNLMLVLSDGGGIYTQGRTGETLVDGERVQGNVVRDQYGSGHAIYTDNGSSMITVSGNVMFHTDMDNWGSRHKDWYDGEKGENFDPLTIEGNYWQQGDQDSSKENVTEKGNKLINSLAGVPATVIESAGLEPAFRDIAALRFARAAPPEPPSRVAAWVYKDEFGKGVAYVTWCPSVNEGGSAVQSYVVRASGAGGTRSAETRISSADFWKYTYVKMTGLPRGEPLSFTIAAVNREGESVTSLPSLPVTPGDERVAVPNAPEHVSVLPGKGMVSVHFQLPGVGEAASGGQPTTQRDAGHPKTPVIAYTVTVRPGGKKVVFTGRNVVALEGTHTTFNVVDGLPPGDYTFEVRAVNPAGEGAPATVGPVHVR